MSASLIEDPANRVLEGPRELVYVPAANGRRTEYEQIVNYVQPNPKYSISTTFNGFPSGRGMWDPESSRIFAEDWFFGFRDPAQLWNRTYIARQTAQEEAIERVVRFHGESGALAKLDHQWVKDALGDIYLPFTFLDYAIYRSMTYAYREALSDVVGVVIGFNAFDKMRHSEDVLFYQLDLLDAGLPMREDSAKELWMSAPQLQGVRRVAERLMATRDWGEVAVATNLVIEPLIGRYVYDEVLLQGAGRNQDHTTPAILVEAGRDRQRNRDWTEALVAYAVGEPTHGSTNREAIKDWLVLWHRDVSEAIAGLAGYGTIERLSGSSPDEIERRVQEQWSTYMDQLGILTTVKEGS